MSWLICVCFSIQRRLRFRNCGMKRSSCQFSRSRLSALMMMMMMKTSLQMLSPANRTALYALRRKRVSAITCSACGWGRGLAEGWSFPWTHIKGAFSTRWGPHRWSWSPERRAAGKPHGSHGSCWRGKSGEERGPIATSWSRSLAGSAPCLWRTV